MKRISNNDYMLLYAIAGGMILISGLIMLFSNKYLLLMLSIVLLLIAAIIVIILGFCHREDMDERIEEEVCKAKATTLDVLLLCSTTIFAVLSVYQKNDMNMIRTNLGIFIYALLFIVLGFSLLLMGSKYLIIERTLKKGINFEDEEDSDQ